ncbi:MAG: hypothetical protein AAF152_18710 [Cyanobacteria bacterium P01_A01_bin.114]
MDLSKIFIQLMIALICATVANLVIPKRIPGKSLGPLVVGFGGVVVGEWVVDFLQSTFNFSPAFLHWDIYEVPIIPALLGAILVLYGLTALVGMSKA